LASFEKDYTGMHGQQNIKFDCFLLLQAKLLESSHAWLGASTSSLAGK
jgi:hypothetical protein